MNTLSDIEMPNIRTNSTPTIAAKFVHLVKHRVPYIQVTYTATYTLGLVSTKYSHPLTINLNKTHYAN